jgi:hypothetical protein
MRLTHRRPATLLGSLGLVAALSLSACGSDDSDESTTPAETSAETEAETEVEPEVPEDTDETDESEEAGEAGSGGSQPAWARPLAEPEGELLTTVEAGDVSVDVYQLGTVEADDTGSFVDPDTNKPLIEVGDTLVFLNYVITNNGDPVDLGFSLVDVSARYDDWPYLGGMDGLSSSDLFEAQGVNTTGPAPTGEDAPFTLGTGETFSYGDNFEYQQDSPITFDVTYTPVDSEGELLSDERVEGEGTAVIS